MNVTLGIVFLVAFVVLLWIGRARQGEPRKFMQVWIVGMPECAPAAGTTQEDLTRRLSPPVTGGNILYRKVG